MKKIIYTIGAFIMASSFFSIFKAMASGGDLTLQSNQEPSIFTGHHSHSSHSSHASHYSGIDHNIDDNIYLTKITNKEYVNVEPKFKNKNLPNCIIDDVYIAEIEFKTKHQKKFKGKALIISIMDEYGNNERSPRIKITTHIIPFDITNKKYYTTNGHLGYGNLQQLENFIGSDIEKQIYTIDWIERDKKDWMYKFNSKFYNNIIKLTY